MIRVSQEGNTTINLTGGAGPGGTYQWTVYPYFRDNPTFQGVLPEKKRRIEGLSITDFRGKEDLSGRKLPAAQAEAIARLKRNLEEKRNLDLGLTVDQIDVEPEGKRARILAEKYGIRPIETEGQASPETKG